MGCCFSFSLEKSDQVHCYCTMLSVVLTVMRAVGDRNSDLPDLYSKSSLAVGVGVGGGGGLISFDR